MCTLCLSDMGELRDEWLREPRAKPAVAVAAALPAALLPAAPRAPAPPARLLPPSPRTTAAVPLLREASHA